MTGVPSGGAPGSVSKPSEGDGSRVIDPDEALMQRLFDSVAERLEGDAVEQVRRLGQAFVDRVRPDG